MTFENLSKIQKFSPQMGLTKMISHRMAVVE